MHYILDFNPMDFWDYMCHTLLLVYEIPIDSGIDLVGKIVVAADIIKHVSKILREVMAVFHSPAWTLQWYLRMTL